MRIAFITDRPQAGPAASPQFGDGPEAGPVRWGFTRVAEAPGSEEGWEWTPDGDPSVPGNVVPAQPEDVLSAIRAHLDSGPDAALLVHIHGAGNEAPKSFARTAKLCTIYGGPDLRLMGLVVSWATGRFSIDDYLVARQRVIDAPDPLATAFAQLLRGLRTASPGGPRAFLLAHSLGGHLLTCLVRRLAATDPIALQPVFREALLLAVDIDADSLEQPQKLQALERLAQEIHVYYSPYDSLPGLSLIGGFFIPERDGPALGNIGPRPRAAATRGGTPLDSVQWWPDQPPMPDGGPDRRHHYWHTEANVIEDVRGVLRGMSPKTMPWREWNWVDKPTYTIR